MTATRITTSTALPVPLADARDIVGADLENGVCALDGRLTQAIKAIAGEAEHMTGRALLTQTWRVTLDAFPAEIRLPNAPLASITSLKYYDAAGVQQTLAPSAYLIVPDSEPGRVVPAVGTSWPTTACRPGAVEVVYVCGFGSTDAAVPDEFKQYILARLQQQFAPVATAKHDAFDGLLDRWRVY